MIIHRKCHICGAEEFNPAYRCKDHLVSQSEFSILKCAYCGFLFTQTIPGPGEIESYYESPEYISHTGGRRSLTDRLYAIARKVMLDSKASIISKFTGGCRGIILDIGAGTGHFVSKMRDIGWEAFGVEVNETAREQALKINKVSLIGSLEEAAFPAGTFDAVTMWHVLEHIHEPEDYLSVIASILKPEGILVVALPNPLSADAGHYADDWAAFDVPRHLWHFSRDNLDMLMKRAGFRSVALKRMPLDAFYISILSERNRKSSLPLIKGLLKGFFFLMVTLFRKQASSSLMYIYRLKS